MGGGGIDYILHCRLDQFSDPTYFNSDKEISKVDPKLWAFIQSITKTNSREGSSAHE